MHISLQSNNQNTNNNIVYLYSQKMIKLIFWVAAAVSAAFLPYVESRMGSSARYNGEFHPEEEVRSLLLTNDKFHPDPGAETKALAQMVILTLTLDAQDKEDPTSKQQLLCSYEQCSLEKEEQVQVFKMMYNDEFHPEEEDGNGRYLSLTNDLFHPSSCPEKLLLSQDTSDENVRYLSLTNDLFHQDGYCLITATTPTPLGANENNAASVMVIPLLWAGNMLLFTMM